MKLKRLFSAFLAVAMVGINTLGSILPVVADDTAPIIINQPARELDDGVKISKTAEPVAGYVNKYKITLRVEAPKSEKTSDTVLVIDHSNSMNGSKLSNAKTAANSLANVLLPVGNTVNRIAVVSYGESVKNETTDFSNQYSVVSSAISGISENGGGTFTQAAMRRAAQLIATSTATYKTVILLSDGAPSYSYGIKNVDTSADLVNADTVYGNRWQFKVMTSADKFNYNNQVGDGMGNASIEGSEMWDEAGSARINNRYVDYYYNHGNSAIAEANFYKATGNTLYTIALDAGTWGNDTLGKMATTGKNKTATEENLKSIFDEIAGEISSLIKTAHVEDIMGTGVVVSGETGDAATTLTWDLEAKDFTLSDNGEYFYAEKSYEVDFTDDLQSVMDEESEEIQYFALNKKATITYNDNEPVEFPVPSARPFKINIEKILTKIENGVETNLPDGEEFRFKISNVDKVFSVKSGEKHIVPVTVPIAINTSYTVTEENWVAEGSSIKYENYKVTYPEGNTFTISGNQANEEVHIVIKNTYETTAVSASKVWADEEDRDGLRENYDDLFVAVKDGDKYVGYEAITADGGSYTISNLPKYRNNTAIDYTVLEATGCTSNATTNEITCTPFISDEKYTATIKDGVITNTHTPEKIDLLIKKSWVGNDSLPDAITVNVSGGSYNKDFTITKDDKVEGECAAWCKVVPGLYKYENKGQEIKYKAKEISTIWAQNAGFIEYGTEQTADGQKSVKGRWDASETNSDETWTITNTWTPAEFIYNGSTDFKVKKVDAEGNPLAGVKFNINGDEVTTGEDGMITIEIPANLLVQNEEKNFEIEEVETLDGYDLDGDKATLNVVIESALESVNEMTLTNTYAKKFTFTASGNKNYVWNKDERMFVLRNERSEAKSLVIEKIYTGISEDELKESDLSFTISGPDDFEEKTVAISEFVFVNDAATFTIVNLPTGEYTIAENGGEVEGYTMKIDGESEYSVEMVKDGEETVSFTNIYDKIPEPEPTCETDPTMEECKEPEPEPTCETDPTMEGCEEPEPTPVDPCKEDGGCGGIVVPDITPNTGKFSKNGGGKVEDESLIVNYVIGFGATVLFALPIVFAKKREEELTK